LVALRRRKTIVCRLNRRITNRRQTASQSRRVRRVEISVSKPVVKKRLFPTLIAGDCFGGGFQTIQRIVNVILRRRKTLILSDGWNSDCLTFYIAVVGKFIKLHPEIEKAQPIRYHFFLSIINAYDRQFHEARNHNRILTERFGYFNSKLQDIWRDSSNGEVILFECIIILKNKRKVAHIPSLQNWFPLRSGSISQDVKNGDICTVELKFYPYGINALLKEVLKPQED
jgi:hypothetical protein